MFIIKRSIANPRNHKPFFLLIFLRIRVNNHTKVAPIERNNQIGYTPLNLFNALSGCSACIPREEEVTLPTKSSPNSKNIPNGIIAAMLQKNNTSM
jgi:hypothetical protein